MLPYSMPAHDFSVNVLRRKELAATVKEQNPKAQGLILLFAGFETGTGLFRQESSFYYYSGLREPGVVLAIDLHGSSELFIPNCDQERAKWMTAAVALTQANASNIGISKIQYLGSQCAGYQFHPFFPKQEYDSLLAVIEQVISNGGKIFTLSPHNAHAYIEQRLVLERLNGFLPGFKNNIIDISAIVAAMRRKKDRGEIEQMYKAVEITMLAQEAAAHALEEGILECEVQASLEYMFTGSGARAAFPSIVAAGKNSTVLHYHDNNAALQNGDLIVVDIGAESEYYCADLTRTYPVSGTFTPRQREVYNLVLQTQEYIAELAKPGMWLSNKEHPDKSLNHLAKKYLEERGYGKYFTHGIGHYLGLDVHDVGDYSIPLQENDVITIEPGIYIPEEKIGIRIEDDYWIVRDGVICLSEHLPKLPKDIEAMVQQQFSEESEDMDSDEFDDVETDD